MSNIFAMFSTTTRAMQANSFMISTASHNIANVETEGFSRQRVQLVAGQPVSYLGIGQLGTGVDIDSIRRLRDGFLDTQIRYETSILNKYTTAQSSFDQIETIFKEPSETGLSAVMNNFWNGWSQLANDPTGKTGRTLVAEQADDLAQYVNHMYEQMETLSGNIVKEQEGEVYSLNSLLSDLQDTTDQIYQVKLQGMEPNDLLDRRDLLLEKVAAIVNINVDEDKFGRVRITEADSGNNYELLNYSKANPPEYTMSVVRDAVYEEGVGWKLTIVPGGDSSKAEKEVYVGGPPDNDNFYQPGDVLMQETGGDIDDIELKPYRPQLGSLGGNQMALGKVNSYMDDLDMLAYSIASAVNTVHGPLIDASGAAIDKSSFFTVKNPADGLSGYPDDGVTSIKGAAKNLKVSDDIMNDATMINTKMDTANGINEIGRVNAILALRDTKLDTSSIDALNEQLTDKFDPATLRIASDSAGSTTTGFYTDLIGKIGVDSRSSQRNIDNQEVLLGQLYEKQASTSGVSIDEEVASLMQFMTAYQANARVINTLQMMLDTLINLKQ